MIKKIVGLCRGRRRRKVAGGDSEDAGNVTSWSECWLHRMCSVCENSTYKLIITVLLRIYCYLKCKPNFTLKK